MNRLYKFFFLLYCILFVVSFIYSFLVCWGTVELVCAKFKIGSGGFRANEYLKLALLRGFLYALALFLILVALIHKSYQNGQKFTVRQIISTSAWFYAATTIVYLLYYLVCPDLTLRFTIHNSLYEWFLPTLLWIPFPFVWIILFAIFFSKIKSR